MKFATALITTVTASSIQAAAAVHSPQTDSSVSKRLHNEVFGIPYDTIFEAEAGLLNGTLSTNASGYATFLNVLGFNTTYAFEVGFHEGESTEDVFKTFAKLIGARIISGPTEHTGSSAHEA